MLGGTGGLEVCGVVLAVDIISGLWELLVEVQCGAGLGAYTAPCLREVVHSEGCDRFVEWEDVEEESMVLPGLIVVGADGLMCLPWCRCLVAEGCHRFASMLSRDVKDAAFMKTDRYWNMAESIEYEIGLRETV